MEGYEDKESFSNHQRWCMSNRDYMYQNRINKIDIYLSVSVMNLAIAVLKSWLESNPDTR
jgi:hypothetical protein